MTLLTRILKKLIELKTKDKKKHYKFTFIRKDYGIFKSLFEGEKKMTSQYIDRNLSKENKEDKDFLKEIYLRFKNRRTNTLNFNVKGHDINIVLIKRSETTSGEDLVWINI